MGVKGAYKRLVGAVLDDNERVTVQGLCVNDVNPGHDEDDSEVETEIHPTYYVEDGAGVDFYSGKKYAGSPIKMHPCSLRQFDASRPECGEEQFG